MDMKLRTCNCCLQAKPLSEFYRDRNRWQMKCKPCQIRLSWEYQKRRRAESAEVRRQHYETTKRWRKRHPEARRRQNARYNATHQLHRNRTQIRRTVRFFKLHAAL